ALLPVPAALREQPVLDRAQVTALTELGRRVAAHYGTPQDVEWALAGGQLYLVQARPITSLFPLPRPEPPAAAGLRVYVSFNLVVEGVVENFTPIWPFASTHGHVSQCRVWCSMVTCPGATCWSA